MRCGAQTPGSLVSTFYCYLVYLPKLGLREVVVEEGGRPVWAGGALQAGAAGVTLARETDSAVVIQCGSGSYAFELKGR